MLHQTIHDRGGGQGHILEIGGQDHEAEGRDLVTKGQGQKVADQGQHLVGGQVLENFHRMNWMNRTN